MPFSKIFTLALRTCSSLPCLGIYSFQNPLLENSMNFFIRPEILFLIPLFIGVLLLLHFHSRKKVRQRIRLLVADKLKTSLIPSLSPQNTLIKLCLSLSAVCLILFSIAGPNWGFEQKIETRGNDLIIAVDISRSMLVRDQYPNGSKK